VPLLALNATLPVTGHFVGGFGHTCSVRRSLFPLFQLFHFAEIPVLLMDTIGMSLARIVGRPVPGTSSRTFADKEVQVDIQVRLEVMGYERAMDAVLDVAVRMRSIQEAVLEVGGIAQLLVAQTTSPTSFVPVRVESLSESEEVGGRLDEID